MNLEDLPGLSLLKNSGIVLKRKRIHVALTPKQQEDVEQNILKNFDKHKKMFHADLGGVLLDYDRVQIRRRDLRDLPRWPYLHLSTEADFFLFHPRNGLRLVCRVSKKAVKYMECLFLSAFSVSVSKSVVVDNWMWDRVELGMAVEVEIISVGTIDNVPIMEGRLVEGIEKIKRIEQVEEFYEDNYEGDSGLESLCGKRKLKSDEEGRKWRKLKKRREENIRGIIAISENLEKPIVGSATLSDGIVLFHDDLKQQRNRKTEKKDDIMQDEVNNRVVIQKEPKMVLGSDVLSQEMKKQRKREKRRKVEKRTEQIQKELEEEREVVIGREVSSHEELKTQKEDNRKAKKKEMKKIQVIGPLISEEPSRVISGKEDVSSPDALTKQDDERRKVKKEKKRKRKHPELKNQDMQKEAEANSEIDRGEITEGNEILRQQQDSNRQEMRSSNDEEPSIVISGKEAVLTPDALNNQEEDRRKVKKEKKRKHKHLVQDIVQKEAEANSEIVRQELIEWSAKEEILKAQQDNDTQERHGCKDESNSAIECNAMEGAEMLKTQQDSDTQERHGSKGKGKVTLSSPRKNKKKMTHNHELEKCVKEPAIQEVDKETSKNITRDIFPASKKWTSENRGAQFSIEDSQDTLHEAENHSECESLKSTTIDGYTFVEQPIESIEVDKTSHTEQLSPSKSILSQPIEDLATIISSNSNTPVRSRSSSRISSDELKHQSKSSSGSSEEDEELSSKQSDDLKSNEDLSKEDLKLKDLSKKEESNIKSLRTSPFQTATPASNLKQVKTEKACFANNFLLPKYWTITLKGTTPKSLKYTYISPDELKFTNLKTAREHEAKIKYTRVQDDSHSQRALNKEDDTNVHKEPPSKPKACMFSHKKYSFPQSPKFPEKQNKETSKNHETEVRSPQKQGPQFSSTVIPTPVMTKSFKTNFEKELFGHDKIEETGAPLSGLSPILKPGSESVEKDKGLTKPNLEESVSKSLKTPTSKKHKRKKPEPGFL